MWYRNTDLIGVFKQGVRNHLLRLSFDDRYLRFFSAFSDYAIDGYINSFDKVKDDGTYSTHVAGKDLFYVELAPDSEDFTVVGFLHLACLNDKECEIGFSVDADHRRKGIALRMFWAAFKKMEQLGYERAYMNCLHQNVAVQQLVKKFNATLSSDRYGKMAVIELGGISIGDRQLYDAAHRSSLAELKKLKEMYGNRN